MRTYPLNAARAEFSKLFDRALAGEPQRVTRYGKDAVVIVSEAVWHESHKRPATLGALLADFARREGFEANLFERERLGAERELGKDFLGED